MRASILTAAAMLLLIVTALLAVTPGVADDAADQRLNDLETRVAALETRVAKTPSAASSSSQQSNASSSSSNSSNSSYTATFSGNGDREIEIEIDTAGTYQMTATTTSAFSSVIEDAEGNPVPGFMIDVDGAETFTRSDRLEQGTHLLRVSAPDSWNLTLILLDG